MSHFLLPYCLFTKSLYLMNFQENNTVVCNSPYCKPNYKMKETVAHLNLKISAVSDKQRLGSNLSDNTCITNS